LAVLVVAAGTFVPWPRADRITPETVSRIRPGMSQAEVEALLGPPADLSSGPLLDNGYVDCVPDGPRPLGEYRPSCRESMSGLEWDRAEWRSDTHVARVRYLPPGTVYDASITDVRRPDQAPLENLVWRAKRQWHRWFPG
jgi:hypothetical protein